MISITQICNLALSHIGQRPILELTDNSNEARKCSLFYELARDATLRAHNWSFAKCIEQLAVIADEEISGWSILYMRPTNCVHIRRIFNEATVNEAKQTQYIQLRTPNNKRAIATNIDLAYAEFTRKITESSDFDALFVEALSFNMAGLLSKSLTGDLNQGAAMDTKFRALLSDAQRINLSEQNFQREPYNTYIDVR